MTDASPVHFFDFAPWFVPQTHSQLPETIYDKGNYDEMGVLNKADPVNIRLHLQRNAIVRRGQQADHNDVVYDFSLERMALHEIMAELLTRYSFDSKEQFIEVCQTVKDKIYQGIELTRLYRQYDEFWETARSNLALAIRDGMTPVETTGLQEAAVELESRARLNRRVHACKDNIDAFKSNRPYSIHSVTADALGQLRDEWADIEPRDYLVKLIMPALMEEERVRWKERALRRLIGGGPEESQKGLLERTIAELAPTNEVIGHLKPLTKFPKERRKSFLVVGGMAAGKSGIIKSILHEGQAVATLNTDWIKSMLFDDLIHHSTADATQFGSLTHRESYHVFDLAANRWRGMARDEGLAPHLIAEAAQAASWQIDLASAGDTRTDIRVAVAPPRQAVEKAYARGLPGGSDQGRFPPTEGLLDSHRSQFRTNLAAMIKGLPLTFWSTAPRDPAIDGKHVATVLNERGTSTNIATYDPVDKILEIGHLPEMLDYFGNRGINVYACRAEEIDKSPITATAANLLEYAKHMMVYSDVMEINCTGRPADPNSDSNWKFTCDITNSWEVFCKKLGGEVKAREWIGALAKQASYDKPLPEFTVEFRFDKASAGTREKAEVTIAEARSETASPDSALRLQALGRQLAQEARVEGGTVATGFFRQYAAALKQLLVDTQYATDGYHVIKCEPWLENAFPKVIDYLRRKAPAPQAKGLGEFLLFEADAFKTQLACFDWIGQANHALASGKSPDPKKTPHVCLAHSDQIGKNLDHGYNEEAGMAFFIPRVVNHVAAIKLDRPIPLLNKMPSGLGLSELNATLDGQSEAWLVAPQRYLKGLKERLAEFDTFVSGKSPDWQRALSSLFHADGTARFPCVVMENEKFRRSFHEVPPHDEEYMAMLAQLLHAYRRDPNNALKLDHTGQYAYVMVQVEKKKTYRLSSETGRNQKLPTGAWFGIEVPVDTAAREKEIRALQEQVINHDTSQDIPFLGFSDYYVKCCCKPLSSHAAGAANGAGQEGSTQAAELWQRTVPSPRHVAKAGGWRRRDGSRPWMPRLY